MSLTTRRVSSILLGAVIVVAAIAVGACSRSGSVPDTLTGPSRGASSFANVALSGLSVAPASVTGGASAAGTVTLAGPAPSGGLVVKLASNRAGVGVPASITVATGATSAGFSVTTSTVTATVTATISATLGGVVRTAALAITAGAAPPPVPVVSANPCASLTGLTATVVNATADVKQFRVNRLRLDVSGDTPRGTINTLAGCVPTAAPAVSFLSGTGNVTRGGASVTATGAPLSFGPLLFPGVALEPGVVINTDAAGNVLEIVWPALAGLPPGPPVLRIQLAAWNPSVATGDVLGCTMTFTAKAPDGTTATFSVAATGMVVPPLR